VAQWEERSQVLRKARKHEILTADTQEFVRSMSGVFESLLAHLPARNTSGLVEQQKIFSRLPR